MEVLAIRRSHSLPPLLSVFCTLLFIPACVKAATVVSGSVYCDQCLDGHRTVWALPLNGAKVQIECKDSNGMVTLSKEGTTDVFGSYALKFDGSPNMGGCTAGVVSSPRGSCNITGKAVQPLSLSWKLFGMSMYSSEGLSYKPSKPMSFCPKGSKGVSLPPLPYTKLSACSYNYWLNPQYKCYWRVWSPSTKISLWYGSAAAKRYGANTTLAQGLRGSGEINRVLLRETITATLNAFNSLAFYYNAIEVDYHFNQALQGSSKDVLTWATNFRRANSGYNGKAKCLMTPC